MEEAQIINKVNPNFKKKIVRYGRLQPYKYLAPPLDSRLSRQAEASIFIFLLLETSSAADKEGRRCAI